MTPAIQLIVNINDAAGLAAIFSGQQAAPVAPTAAATPLIPAVGEYWPGQGGKLIGLHPKGGYLVAGEPLEGKFQFGRYDQDLAGFSPTDGETNTRALVNLGGTPAAQATYDYTADGHHDFYLPSQTEGALILGALGLSHGAFWTSTPFGSYDAWAVLFERGGVDYWPRLSEFRVRPVRRVIPSFIQPFAVSRGEGAAQ
ncbi:DUF1566 domain-containing protein [Achromobacter sp. 2789STDY5608628]|uniref:DUF1566 domain-containing protein n=1 Tax=Achromobacter sp. 2789STDY5608628 TaxID=1806493 RepID=UPI0006C040F6|nr:DUF1566 domain-containing protein [Achromobacter sp. 2789STDY5608628]CUJ67875.1 Uncharacterised protein [Achromobacter sp. 2789STDY5608628]